MVAQQAEGKSGNDAAAPPFDTNNRLKIYTAWFCPYAQRAIIAANELGIPYEAIEGLEIAADGISYRKDPGLLTANPKGMVPTMVVVSEGDEKSEEEKVIVDSLACVEYLDEMAFTKSCSSQKKSLFPPNQTTAHEEAHRVDRECCSPFYRVLVRKSEEERREAFRQLCIGLEAFGQRMDTKGPFFYGPSPSIVDVALFPWVYRLYLLEHFRGADFSMDKLMATTSTTIADSGGGLTKLAKWRDAMIALPSVRDTLQDKKRLIGAYQRYADGTAKSKVADAVRAGLHAHEHA